MNLNTTYMGLKLKNPIVSSAGPLAAHLSTVRQLEDAGVGAIVLHSLFQEQIEHEAAELTHFTEQGVESHAEALSYFPEPHEYRLGPDEYLEHVRKAREAVEVPVIASLNGSDAGGWIEYARRIEQAGASALELNLYFVAADPNLSSLDVEQRHLDVLRSVKSSVRIPVAIKLSPYFSALANMATRLDEAGADALVLFNRFYQPDIDLDTLEVVPNLVLSTAAEMRLPLRWIAILYGRIRCSLAATSGVSTGADVIRLMMAGADVAQVCSALLRNGVGEVGVMLNQMKQWMHDREYESIDQMKGSMSQMAVAEPAAFERANYMKALSRYV